MKPLSMRNGPWHVRAPLPFICVLLVGRLPARGAWIGLLHPADPGGDLPSLMASSVVQVVRAAVGGVILTFDQCMFGAPCRRRTMLLTNDASVLGAVPSHCLHRRGRLPSKAVQNQMKGRGPLPRDLVLLLGRRVAARAMDGTSALSPPGVHGHTDVGPIRKPGGGPP